MRSVGIAISRTLRVNTRLRPRVSLKCAITMPPIGPRQVTSSKDSKSLSLANPIRPARGKEQLTDYGGEEDEDDEVIEFQCASDRCEREDADFRRRQLTVFLRDHYLRKSLLWA